MHDSGIHPWLIPIGSEIAPLMGRAAGCRSLNSDMEQQSVVPHH